MILFAARCAFAILIIGTAFIFWKLVRKQLSMKNALLAVAIHICVAVVLLLTVVPHIPPLTDNVTITATGEKGANAKAEEVFLKGYTIDEIYYSVSDDLTVTEGQWFWSSTAYCWRIEADSRQPDGVTRSVTIGIPVGWSRTLDFHSSVWSGIVEVTGETGSRYVDLYSSESGTRHVDIGKSDTTLLICNQLRVLALCCFVILLLLVCELTLVRRIRNVVVRDGEWLKRNMGRLFRVAVSVGVFCWMFMAAEDTSLWADELLQIRASRGTIWHNLEFNVRMVDATPPLFGVIASVWYKIAPYGEKWLLLINILPTVLSIYLVGEICERITEKYLGLLTSVAMALSSSLWNNVAYEFRSYAFLLLFSCLTLYYYLRRNESEKGNKSKWNWLQFASMTAMAMSHYFGMFACALYFVADVYLCAKGKFAKKDFLFYALPAGMCVFWLGIVYLETLSYRSAESIASWYPVPGTSHIKDLLFFLSGNTQIVFVALLLGLSIAFVSCRKMVKKHDWTAFYVVFAAVAICVSIALMWGYGNFLNQESTMWTHRYFLFLLPFVYVLLSAAFSFVCVRRTRSIQVVCLCVALILFFDFSPPNQAMQSNQNWRGAANWIYGQINYIYNDSTLVTGKYVDEAWNEYYVTQKGRRDSINVAYYNENLQERVAKSNRIYYVYLHNGAPSGWLKNVLENEFTLVEDKTDIDVLVYERN